MPCCGTLGLSKGRLPAIVFEPLSSQLGPAWLVRRGSFFVRHVYCGYGFVKLADIRCGKMGGKHVFRKPKGHPHGYQLGKSITRMCAGAGVFAGFGMCSRGCNSQPVSQRGNHHRWFVKIFGGARVREGHPTPPAFAMQTRHLFCIF